MESFRPHTPEQPSSPVPVRHSPEQRQYSVEQDDLTLARSVVDRLEHEDLQSPESLGRRNRTRTERQLRSINLLYDDIRAEQTALLTHQEEAALGTVIQFRRGLLRQAAQQNVTPEQVAESTKQRDTLVYEELDRLCRQDPEIAKAARIFQRRNVRLISSRVHRYLPMVDRRSGLEAGDLFGFGALGVYNAALRYDPTRTIRFGTYATWWIDQSIRRGVCNQQSLIRLPVYLTEFSTTVARIERELEVRHGVVDPNSVIIVYAQECVLNKTNSDSKSRGRRRLSRDAQTINLQERLETLWERLGQRFNIDTLLAMATAEQTESTAQSSVFDEFSTEIDALSRAHHEISKVRQHQGIINVQSLDRPINDDGTEITFADVLVDPRADEQCLSDQVTREEAMRRILDQAEITDRDREILRMRFGFESGEPMTMAAIGEYFGLSRERIRQISKRAIEKIQADTDTHDRLRRLHNGEEVQL